MRHVVLWSLVTVLALGSAFLTRTIALPIAKAVQSRIGYSDQFVSEVSLALPFGASLLAALAYLTWILS